MLFLKYETGIKTGICVHKQISITAATKLIDKETTDYVKYLKNIMKA